MSEPCVADVILRKIVDCGYWSEHDQPDGSVAVCVDGWITLTPDEYAYLNATFPVEAR